jgi:hypothetical protein
MSQEKFYPLRVRPDNNAGRVSNEKKLEESDDVLTTFWPELYQAFEKEELEPEEDFHPIPEQES